MSNLSEPKRFAAMTDEVDFVVMPRVTERFKGFKLRRALGHIPYLSVGPFVLFDHFGPVTFAAGAGLDAPPHPHVGMATLSYLFEGELVHRDGMGNTQRIRPGETNWMVAGRGTAHSERTPSELRREGSRLAGVQMWLGLPTEHEEDAPRFEHHSADALPIVEVGDARVRVVVGTFGGARSPVGIHSQTLFADVEIPAGGNLVLPLEDEERAAYVVSGKIAVSGQIFPEVHLVVFRPGKDVAISAVGPTRMLILGGARLDGPRHRWSTVVSSRAERRGSAQADWSEGRIASVVDEAERGVFPNM